MADCFITQPIHDDGLALLRAAGCRLRFATAADAGTVAREIGSADVVITRDAGLNAAAMRAAPRLGMVASHGVGVNRIDLDQARAQGLLVTNTPDTNTRAVAEYTIGLMLALARRVLEADRAVRAGNWAFRHEAGPIELRNRTLGLAGFGTIARQVAAIAQAGFAMKVSVWSPHAPDDALAAAGVTRAASLADLLGQSDVISLHRPLREDTANMIDEASLHAIRPGALLINTRRGGLIDIPALHRALRDGRVGAAALDVFTTEPPADDDPVRTQPRTILTPHLGGTTAEALSATASLCARQVIAALRGETPPHVVLAPPGDPFRPQP